MEIHLSPTEFDLLSLFVLNKGTILPKDILTKCIWGTAYTKATSLLKTTLCHLRNKLCREEAQKYILSKYGEGYYMKIKNDDAEQTGASADSVFISVH